MSEERKEAPVRASLPQGGKIVELPAAVSVRQLSQAIRQNPIEVIKQLMRNGLMANINEVIDYEAAAKIAADFGIEVRPQAIRSAASRRKKPEHEETKHLPLRPPVVTIMGHVDHGKTRLLDAIRQTHVMESEAGGITQHIGAYQVEVKGQKITFLDTPGHEAFTAMRARGARATDITVLVVAADDGIMPQTLEAIDHARAAGVPIIVAINKIDKPGANADRVKQQLADHGLVVEDWGGDTIAVGTSAKERLGIDDLLENILLVAEMEDLHADPTLPGTGVVIEAEMDKSRGAMATVLVQNGSLKVGDIVVVGETFGKVKAMFNDQGKHLRKAEPATPVVIMGLPVVPGVGDTLASVDSERQARQILSEKKAVKKPVSVSLASLHEQIASGKVKELNIILKTDVQGSIEPIRTSLEKLATDKLTVHIIHSGTGNVTENDVMLAIASHGLVIGFSTGVESGATRLADQEKIDIRRYDIIYNLIEDVDKALKGLIEPEIVEVIEGRAEVRAVFPAGKKAKVAGVYVTEGKAARGARVRVQRGKDTLAESPIVSLRRFKDDVREIAAGFEGGVGLETFNEFQPGDVLEFLRKEKSA
ncbi:bacterial translation initiation factor 2 (bIF-2) [Dehalogenimonas alkenigignens]|uniref:Translation initiation factor IF-2 n=1 Tax=Dehalogenimonas alkenigignens TaxID=1217799 RepID=A0A0W0GIJ9_9CHLR|nr:translation initiation factor IF-2 [Dehalogenimonas alkenigignens]KTB48353.1 bacterial translation initiation factor 2 (bIF-2) [Dehalogenimonas alkenigignens]